jgi:hypothetical protein
MLERCGRDRRRWSEELQREVVRLIKELDCGPPACPPSLLVTAMIVSVQAQGYCIC